MALIDLVNLLKTKAGALIAVPVICGLLGLVVSFALVVASHLSGRSFYFGKLPGCSGAGSCKRRRPVK